MQFKDKVVLAVVSSVVIVLSIVLAGFYFQSASVGYVSFDTVKYISARREMTTRLLGSSELEKNEAITVLARVEKNTMQVLSKLAGNNIVIVKQALVLDGQVKDITDSVLMELGLPVDIEPVQPQVPDRLLSRFSLSDDYIESEKLNKEYQGRLQEEINRQEKELEKLQSKEREKNIQRFLP